jgi:hypothetical protein
VRRLWWALAAVVVLGLAGGGVGVALYLNRDRETVDDKYLAGLREAGLTGEFNSNANAIAHGKQVCRQLEDGGKQQGMPVDKVAVEYYCPQFKDGFHVLETITVSGSFTLKDESPNAYALAITVSGSSCSGSGGYGDIDEGTQVKVKNGKGEILTTTFLGTGSGGRFLCTFPFPFDITEGEDRYVVSVSRRGEMTATPGGANLTALLRAAAGGSLVVGPDLSKQGGPGKQASGCSADGPYAPVGVIDQIEALHDRGLMGDREPHVLLADGLSVALPAASEQLMHPHRELGKWERTVCSEHPDCQFGDLGGEGVSVERRPESAHYGEVIVGRAGGP